MANSVAVDQRFNATLTNARCRTLENTYCTVHKAQSNMFYDTTLQQEHNHLRAREEQTLCTV
jgi:hypothetical protein